MKNVSHIRWETGNIKWDNGEPAFDIQVYVGGHLVTEKKLTVEHSLKFDPNDPAFPTPLRGAGQVVITDNYDKEYVRDFKIKPDGSIQVIEPPKAWYVPKLSWAVAAIILVLMGALGFALYKALENLRDDSKSASLPVLSKTNTLATRSAVSTDPTLAAALARIKVLEDSLQETKAIREAAIATMDHAHELQQQVEALRRSGILNSNGPNSASVIIMGASASKTNALPNFGQQPEQISVSVTGHHNNVVIGDNNRRIGYQGDSTNDRPTIVVTNIFVVTNQVIGPLSGPPVGVFNNTINNNSSQSTVASAASEGCWNWFKGGGQVGKIKTSGGEEYDMKDLVWNSTPLLGQRWFTIPGFTGYFARKSEGSTGFTYSQGQQL